MANNNRGFAKLKEEGCDDEVSEIASKGGQAAHQQGNAHEFTSEETREAGRKGGQAAQASGNAHELTEEDRSKGGSMSPGNFKNRPHEEVEEIARKGGQS